MLARILVFAALGGAVLAAAVMVLREQPAPGTRAQAGALPYPVVKLTTPHGSVEATGAKTETTEVGSDTVSTYVTDAPSPIYDASRPALTAIGGDVVTIAVNVPLDWIQVRAEGSIDSRADYSVPLPTERSGDGIYTVTLPHDLPDQSGLALRLMYSGADYSVKRHYGAAIDRPSEK